MFAASDNEFVGSAAVWTSLKLILLTSTCSPPECGGKNQRLTPQLIWLLNTWFCVKCKKYLCCSTSGGGGRGARCWLCWGLYQCRKSCSLIKASPTPTQPVSPSAWLWPLLVTSCAAAPSFLLALYLPPYISCSLNHVMRGWVAAL